jgi:tetratricopeptide (TPR) repeat protein
MIEKNGYDKLLADIALWHDNDEHQKILDAIAPVPRDMWDYRLASFYARALNNLDKYEEALDLLLGLEEQGKEDGKWYFRVGYSLYYLGREEEAAEYFRKAIDFGDDGDDTRFLLEQSLKEAEIKREQAQYDPELYSEEELTCIQDHITRYFGENNTVFHELVSPDIHIDIVIIEPSPARNYYVLVTMGMGAHRMKVPDGLQDRGVDRAELLVCLPPDWKVEETENEDYYWPLRWLKTIARLPGGEDSWIGWGHTISNGGPFTEKVRFTTMMLLYPGAFDKDSFTCKMPDGSVVNFYQLVPLYEEEAQFKIKNNAEILLNFLDDECLEYVRTDRENICEG